MAIVEAHLTIVPTRIVKRNLVHVMLGLLSVQMACAEHFLLLMRLVRVALSGTAVRSMVIVEALRITAASSPATPPLALVTRLL
mgnify:CR=1 FL=1